MDDAYACAFTGHRPEGLPWGSDEDDPRCLRVKSLIHGRITELAERGVTRFLSGMARGIDLICAEEVFLLRKNFPGVSLKCVIPYLGQEKYWNLSEQARYRHITESSGDIVIISPEFTKNCIMARNRYLVENAGTLVAVVAKWKSGTGATVGMARKLKREIIIIKAGEIDGG
jgi:uncharacterized phage-like protein YoqJ